MSKRIDASDFDAVLRARAGVTLETAVRRILRVWARATPADIEAGAIWYGDAGRIADDIARSAGISRERAACVIAQLSPRTTWGRNVGGAYALALTGDAPGCIGANVDRARLALSAPSDALALASINGPKTSRFARNVLGDRDAVTVDVWAARIALDPAWRRGADSDAETVLGRAGVYAAIERAYQIAARRAGVDATTIQATTWVVVRNGRAA